MHSQLQKVAGFSQSQIDAVKENLLRLASKSNDTRAVLAFLEIVGEVPERTVAAKAADDASPAEMTREELDAALVAQGLPPVTIYELPPAPPSQE